MAGTKAGGIKAAKTNKLRHGEEFYAKIGRKGGKNGHTGGFAANPELARIAGKKGGRVSRRGNAPLQGAARAAALASVDEEVSQADTALAV